MDNLEGLTHQTGIIGATKESFSGGLSERAVPSNHIFSREASGKPN